jgi:4-amino-4-deoxy-L-arabinose transferase
MFDSYFTAGQQATITLATALGLGALMLHVRHRDRWALFLLTLAAFVLRLFAAWLDPFLNDWDEVFHAVVAKNMLADPFTPMLYRETALPLTDSWARNHVWLHKPPFFLWQIALSLKLFGLEYWAVRLPSALWMTALVPVTARMAWQFTHDRRLAFGAALFTTFSFYIQELTAGALNTDHNDAIFIPVVACSWWGLLEHWRSRRMGWALLAGMFSGCALLTKWYVGLSVFLPWGLVVLGARLRWSVLRPMLAALLVAGALAGSWVAAMFIRFPALAAFQWGFKAQHFSVPVDGHEGTWTFHFEVIADLLPPHAWWVVLPALAWLVFRLPDPLHRVFVGALVIAVHAFFAVAATKMVSYTLVLLPLYLIALAHLVSTLVDGLVHERWNALVGVAVLALLGLLGLDLDRTQFRHSSYRGELVAQDPWRERMRAQAFEDTLVAKLEGPGPFVLFNVPSQRGFELMFRFGIECIDLVPPQDVVDRLRARGYTVAVLQDTHPPDQLPQGIQLVPDSVLLYPRIPRD